MTDRKDLQDRLEAAEEQHGLARTGSVREWVDRRVESGLADNFEFTIDYGGTDDNTDEVCVMAPGAPDEMWAVWIPAEDVPEWIDVEADLPVVA